MFLSIMITCIIYWHYTLYTNYSMIKCYARYVCIRVTTEKTIVDFLIIFVLHREYIYINN